jgi:hypothetical protein
MGNIVLLAAAVLLLAPGTAAAAGPGGRDFCGTSARATQARGGPIEYAGIIPGAGLTDDDFADGGLLIEADPSLYQVTNDPIGVLTQAARNWEIPGTMIKFRVEGAGAGGNLVSAVNVRQQAYAKVGRPGYGARRKLWIKVDVPYQDGDERLVSILTHEIGHWLGFDHSFLMSTIMSPSLNDRINWVDPDQVAKAVARYGTAPHAVGWVEGRITRNGAGLSGARVNLLGANARTAFGTFASADGSYRVPVYPGVYRLVVDPNDGPGVKGNFIGTYPGGPLDFVTYEAPEPVVVSSGETSVADAAVPGGDYQFRITTVEPITCAPGSSAERVKIYYVGALPEEIAGVDSLSPDIRITGVSDAGGQIWVYFAVDRLAMPGPRAFRLRKTNGAFAILPGAVGVVSRFRLGAPHYTLRAEEGAPLRVEWSAALPEGDPAAVAVSASVDGGREWEEIGRVPGDRTFFDWQPGGGLVSSALRVRVEVLNVLGERLAVDESPFNIGLGEAARGGVGAETGPDAGPPAVLVQGPNGGEVLAAGEPIRVTWSASDDVGIVSQSVEVSLDGGSSWEAIVAVGPIPRAHEFVPDARARGALLVRVTARDAAGNSGSDQSDAAAEVRARPAVERVTLKPTGGGYLLRVSGTGLAANAAVRVNGEAVDVPATFDAARGRLRLRGGAEDLHLNPDGQPNTLVVEVDGLASAEVTF